MLKRPPLLQDTGVAKAAGARSLAPAVERAGRILALLETAPQRPFTVTEIARALSLPKSTALNLCTELQQIQLIRRSHDGYQLGRRLLQLGSSYAASVDIIREFYEVCRRAPAELNAMVQLSVLDEEMRAVFLARQDCNSGLRLGLQAEIGRRVPANCTASGKALLAALPPDELASRVATVTTLEALTERSIKTTKDLNAALARIRKAGFATDDEEVIPGLVCEAIALPTSHREDGLLAVSISALKTGVTKERRTLIHETLMAIGNELQERV